MIYIFLLCYTVLLLFLVENYKSNIYIYIYSLLLLALASSIQYGVGTDYFSYKLIYEMDVNLEMFTNKGELLLPYIINILKYNKLNYQFLFVIVSCLNMLMLALTFKKIKSYNYRVWLFFFMFFCVTGLYHNQMNGLRQYLAIFSFPLIIMFLAEKKYIKSTIFLIYALISHTSTYFIIPFFILAIFPIIRKNKIKIFFITSILYAFIIPEYLYSFLSYFSIGYLTYLDRSENGMTLIPILTKIYYVPVFILFFFLLNKKLIVIKDKVSDVFLSLFSLTYWMFLSAIHIGILGRVSQLTMFFYIFPIYFVFDYYLNKRKFGYVIFLILYILVPYILKVTFFAKNEYVYKWII
ncbi:TPA: EpsG family protein [Photobacterium damselae]